MPDKKKPASGMEPRAGKQITIANPEYSRVGGLAWRKARGLLTWRDHARHWRALRYVPPGALVPLPESLLPRWRERPE